MEKIKKLLQGKKTYISAAALALAAILGWWLGAIDNTNSLALLSTAGALAGLGAKSQRTAEAVLVTLENIRDEQEAHARGQKIDVAKVAGEIAKQIAPQVIAGIVPIQVPSVVTIPSTNQWTVPVCIYCGLPITANGGACTGNNNRTTPDSSGIVRHVFVSDATNAASFGANAK
jgi:hypothetical protein